MIVLPAELEEKFRVVAPELIVPFAGVRNSSLWINKYANWAMKRSPLTPYHFHQNIALTLAAGAIAGRCYVRLPHDRIFPNLYTLLVARTSVLAKTTAVNAAQGLIDATMPDKVTDAVSTPEALMTEFAGIKPSNWESLPKSSKELWERQAAWGARRLFILDEAGMLFNSLRRDYNATLADLIMRLYDTPSKPISRTTMGKGFVSIEKYSLSCLFATTPMAIRQLLSAPDAWMTGFWNRWNFVTQRELTEWKEGEAVPVPVSVIETLRKLSLGWLCKYNDGKPYEVPIDKGAERAFNDYTRKLRGLIAASDDERIDGLLSRIPTKQMKCALILACLDAGDSGKPVIHLDHWEQSQELSSGWHRDALVAMSMAEKSERMSQEEKVLQMITRSKDKQVPARMIQQFLHISAEDTRKILESLKQTNQIKQVMSSRTIFYTTTKDLDDEKEN